MLGVAAPPAAPSGCALPPGSPYALASRHRGLPAVPPAGLGLSPPPPRPPLRLAAPPARFSPARSAGGVPRGCGPAPPAPAALRPCGGSRRRAASAAAGVPSSRRLPAGRALAPLRRGSCAPLRRSAAAPLRLGLAPGARCGREARRPPRGPRSVRRRKRRRRSFPASACGPRALRLRAAGAAARLRRALAVRVAAPGGARPPARSAGRPPRGADAVSKAAIRAADQKYGQEAPRRKGKSSGPVGPPLRRCRAATLDIHIILREKGVFAPREGGQTGLTVDKQKNA